MSYADKVYHDLLTDISENGVKKGQEHNLQDRFAWRT